MESSVTADDFNTHFLSIPHKTISVLPLSDVSPSSFCNTTSVPPLTFAEVTDDEVSVLRYLDPKKPMVQMASLHSFFRRVHLVWHDLLL